jgi:hypothetical protein
MIAFDILYWIKGQLDVKIFEILLLISADIGFVLVVLRIKTGKEFKVL